MKSFILALFMLSTISGCVTVKNKPDVTMAQSRDDFIFLFEGNVFLIPSDFSVAAYFSEFPRAVHFGYGKAKKRAYIVFADGLDDGKEDPGCDWADYARAIFDVNANTTCNTKMVRDDIRDFVKGADTGIWHGKNSETIYYSIGGLAPSLWVVDKNRKLIYITYTPHDTPHVSKKELRKVVEKLL